VLLTNYNTTKVETSPFGHPTNVNQAMPAKDALQYVIQNVGASRVRDAVDLLLIKQLTSYGKEGEILTTEDDNGISGNVGTVANGTPPKDTDKDGMPDEWETKRGLNPKVADDKGDDDKDGYTNIEEYLSCLVGEGDGCTPISTDLDLEATNLEQVISVYPNPSKASFHVSISKTTNMQVIDLEGKIQEEHNNVLSTEFGEHLKPGIYFLKIEGNVYKLLKE